MAEHRELSAQERAGKAFPVSWDQFHRDCRALTWRLNEVGPFHAVIAITRGRGRMKRAGSKSATTSCAGCGTSTGSKAIASTSSS